MRPELRERIRQSPDGPDVVSAIEEVEEYVLELVDLVLDLIEPIEAQNPSLEYVKFDLERLAEKLW